MAGTCVLFSGGLDSAVLLAVEQRDHPPAQPVHVRSGFAWEDEERRAIDRLLQHPAFAGVSPLRSLAVDLRDVYPPEHWAIAGTPPAYDTPDEDVYLEGRNITLISKAAVLCGRMRIHRLALGPLANNPFPDASPVFFETMARAMSLGIGRELAIVTPLVRASQGRRDQAGRGARRADGAVDVVHEAAGGGALWRLQQVPRAA